MKIIDQLTADGWREYPDQLRTYYRCFFKRFYTPTVCRCNDDKEGLQVCVAVSEHNGVESYEIDLCGELPDGSWIKLQNWATLADFEKGSQIIPKLLRTWEFINAEMTRPL